MAKAAYWTVTDVEGLYVPPGANPDISPAAPAGWVPSIPARLPAGLRMC